MGRVNPKQKTEFWARAFRFQPFQGQSGLFALISQAKYGLDKGCFPIFENSPNPRASARPLSSIRTAWISPRTHGFRGPFGPERQSGMSEAFPSPFRGSKRAPEAFSEADALPRPAPCAAAWRPGRGLKRPVRLCGHKKTPPPGNPGSRESEIYNYFPASFLYMARRAAASSSFFLNRLAAASGNCLSRLA